MLHRRLLAVCRLKYLIVCPARGPGCGGAWGRGGHGGGGGVGNRILHSSLFSLPSFEACVCTMQHSLGNSAFCMPSHDGMQDVGYVESSLCEGETKLLAVVASLLVLGDHHIRTCTSRGCIILVGCIAVVAKKSIGWSSCCISLVWYVCLFVFCISHAWP